MLADYSLSCGFLDQEPTEHNLLYPQVENDLKLEIFSLQSYIYTFICKYYSSLTPKISGINALDHGIGQISPRM